MTFNFVYVYCCSVTPSLLKTEQQTNILEAYNHFTRKSAILGKRIWHLQVRLASFENVGTLLGDPGAERMRLFSGPQSVTQ